VGNFCPYLRIQTTRLHYKCSGVKICSNLHPELKNLNHFKITKDIWKKIQEIREIVEISDANEQKKNAIR
jgi:5S rRNA maturation endonuclease (ribonuclease M5)